MKGPTQIIITGKNRLIAKAMALYINNMKCNTVATYDRNASLLNIGHAPVDLILIAILAADLTEKITVVQIQQAFPGVPVAIIAMEDTFDEILAGIKMGICGWIRFTIEPNELQTAINAMVHEKAYYFDLDGERLLYSHKKDIEDPVRLLAAHHLPAPQKKILSLLCSSLSYEEMAVSLHVSGKQLSSFRAAISKALRFKSRVGLALFAIKNNLCEQADIPAATNN